MIFFCALRVTRRRFYRYSLPIRWPVGTRVIGLTHFDLTSPDASLTYYPRASLFPVSSDEHGRNRALSHVTFLDRLLLGARVAQQVEDKKKIIERNSVSGCVLSTFALSGSAALFKGCARPRFLRSPADGPGESDVPGRRSKKREAPSLGNFELGQKREKERLLLCHARRL